MNKVLSYTVVVLTSPVWVPFAVCFAVYKALDAVDWKKVVEKK